MTEKIRRKRPMSAQKMAEKFGISVRTVQRIFAEPRDHYLARSKSQSKPWEALGMSRATWYRKGKPEPEQPDKPTHQTSKEMT
jgi:transcriptional regulator with XRE-family HTH domain